MATKLDRLVGDLLQRLAGSFRLDVQVGGRALGMTVKF